MTANGASAQPPVASLEQVCGSIAELLRAVGCPLRRLTVRAGETVVEIEWSDQDTPPATRSSVVSAEVAIPAHESAQEPAAHLVTAPHVGTFYHSPEPGAAPFVSVGDVVRRGQQIGILEAMKLMNPVEADRDGRVHEVLAGDGALVEFDQPLLAIHCDIVDGQVTDRAQV